MDMRSGLLFYVVATGAVLAAGCGGGVPSAGQQATAPSAVTDGTPLSAYTGTWTSSPGADPVTPGTCRGVQWRLPSTAGSTATGNFSATCAGVQVSGSVTVAMARTSLTWRVGGRAVGEGGQPCAFALSGTATMERVGMRVEYEGTVCGTPVNGTDVWRRP